MVQPGRVAAVILAAGASTRFGSSKQLASVGDRTMLERVVDVARVSGLAPIVAVVPGGVRPPDDVMAVVNDRAQDGMSRSLRLGIEALDDDVAAAVILLGDQPTVPPAWIAALRLQSFGERPVVAMRAQGRIGPPVLLRREAFGLVDEATGDEGLGPTLGRYPELVAHIDVAAHAPDVDTPEDLGRLGQPSRPQPRG